LYQTGIDVFREESGGHVRSCILASRDMNLILVPQFSGKDITTCRWHDNLENKEVYLVSVYSDINEQYINQKLEELIQFCNDNSYELIAGIDSNAHSSLWGCQNNNPRGDFYEDFIIENALTLHNIGAKWTFESHVGKSIIDITLSTSDIANRVSSWRVNTEGLSSDHNRLEWTISCSPPQKSPLGIL
jgi:hypothetical protein